MMVCLVAAVAAVAILFPRHDSCYCCCDLIGMNVAVIVDGCDEQNVVQYKGSLMD